MNPIALFVAVFLASMVESVETATLVLVASVSSPRAAFKGTVAGFAVLAVAYVAIAPIFLLIPLAPLRLVLGSVMIWYGSKWLRKAILRASGRLPKHNEANIYARELAAHKDAYKVAFGGTLMEGTEVIIIVLALSPGHMLLGSIAALAAMATTFLLALIVRGPLTRVPENAIKMMVGTMLVSFGIFWLGEAVSLPWPGADLSLVGLIAATVTVSLLLARVLRPRVAASTLQLVAVPMSDHT